MSELPAGYKSVHMYKWCLYMQIRAKTRWQSTLWERKLGLPWDLYLRSLVAFKRWPTTSITTGRLPRMWEPKLRSNKEADTSYITEEGFNTDLPLTVCLMLWGSYVQSNYICGCRKFLYVYAMGKHLMTMNSPLHVEDEQIWCLYITAQNPDYNQPYIRKKNRPSLGSQPLVHL